MGVGVSWLRAVGCCSCFVPAISLVRRRDGSYDESEPAFYFHLLLTRLARQIAHSICKNLESGLVAMWFPVVLAGLDVPQLCLCSR